MRKILQGVKGRVEGDIEPVWVQNVEFFIFLVTLLIFVAAMVLIFLRRLTWQTWRTGLFAGVIWLTTWYTPIPTWLSALIALIGIGALYLVFRKRAITD